MPCAVAGEEGDECAGGERADLERSGGVAPGLDGRRMSNWPEEEEKYILIM